MDSRRFAKELTLLLRNQRQRRRQERPGRLLVHEGNHNGILLVQEGVYGRWVRGYCRLVREGKRDGRPRVEEEMRVGRVGEGLCIRVVKSCLL